MNEGSFRILTVCITVAAIAIVVMLWQSCDAQRDRRADCMKQGHSMLECKEAFER